MKKINPSLFGLYQALGVTFYCALIGGFFILMQRFNFTPPEYVAITLMLVLLVFSAAICGLLVFGYPVFLVLNKKKNDALALLGYTFLYLIIIFVIFLITALIFGYYG